METTLEQYPICQHCGYEDKEVVETTGYIGGIGYVDGYYCIDTDACWQRWNRKNEGKSNRFPV